MEVSETPEIPPEIADQTPLATLPINRVVTYLALAIIGATADLWSKSAIFAWRGLPGQNSVWWIVEDYLGIETAVNIGALGGFGAGKGSWFAALSILAGVGIVVWLFWFGAAHSRWLTWALGLISGGIIGNLYDRLGIWWQDGFPPAWHSGAVSGTGSCFGSRESLFLTPGQTSISLIRCW